MVTLECGLRELKKQHTRANLISGALRLLAQSGLDGLTAARIADEAGVSRRTFFNYFAKVEDIFEAPIQQIVEETTRAILSRPKGESFRDTTVAALDQVLDGDALEASRALTIYAMESSYAHRLLLQVIDTQTGALEEALRTRIGPDADESYVVALAAAAMAVFGRAFKEVVAADGPDEDFKGDVRAAAHRALDHLFAGFDESRATVTTQVSSDMKSRSNADLEAVPMEVAR